MSNNRTYPRYGTELAVEFTQADADSPAPSAGMICNLSLGGARIITGRQERPGTQLAMSIALDGGITGKLHRAAGVVLRSGASSDGESRLGKYFLAVRFDEPQFELSAILAACREN